MSAQRLKRYTPDGSFSGIGLDPVGQWANLEDCAELLRPIRLHHWRECLGWRTLAAQRIPVAEAERYAALADKHLAMVQQLNEFFEPGDTAEGDAQK